MKAGRTEQFVVFSLPKFKADNSQNVLMRRVFWVDADFFTTVTFEDCGFNIKKLAGLNGLTADVEIEENSLNANVVLTGFEGETVDLFVAAYGSDHKLLGVTKENVSPVTLVDGVFEKSIEVTAKTDDVAYVKVMIWDNNMSPESDAFIWEKKN